MAKDVKNLRKLPSGKWQARKYVKGKTYSILFDHKPGLKEMETAFWNAIGEIDEKPVDEKSFKWYAEDFLKIKSNVLSPSTIKNYRSVLRNLSDAFCGLALASLEASDIQKEINLYSIDRSPKSVKNAHGFITSVCWTYRPDLVVRTKLPQAERKELAIPTDKDIKKLTKAIKGSEYETIILLCMMGLRRSEALSIGPDDIKGNMLVINKATVSGEGGMVEKTTKTTYSTRQIYIPDSLVDLIKAKGIYKGHPNSILRYLHRIQDANNLPHFRLHDLRHYYVSSAHTNGVPDAYIAKAVGHASTATTQRVYKHALSDQQLKMEMKAAKSITKNW